MTDPARLLATHAPEGARLLALDWLERVRLTRATLDDTPDDPEALHALRVALTRLRATLRLYAPVLDGDIGRRGRRALRAANAALGRVRDRDVQAEQLAQLAPSLDEEAQQAACWMRDRLMAQRSDRLQAAQRAVRAHLDDALDPWRHRLSHYTEARIAGVPTPHTPLATIIAQALQQATAALEEQLRAARESADPELLHRARISGKRIRALLVPWLPALADASPLFAQVTQLQDDLGRARDVHLLATRARRHAHRMPERAEALRTLARVLEERAQAALADVERRWLTESAAGAAPQLLEAVPPAMAAIAASAHPSLEIERKFLLHALPEIVRDRAGVRIAQGWLPGERLRERLRRSVHPDGRVEWTRTVKVGTGMSRVELEEDTAAVLFETLWPLTAQARVEKVRYAIPDGALTWEIDVFLDRDLLLAEVELPSEDTPISFPAWLAPCVTREVTGDPAYVNANLACAPRPSASA
jgi:CHAD domain-containing protein/CYTH domain-containing protein